MSPKGKRPAPAHPERQLARSALLVFILGAVIAVVGPLLSYRSDLEALRAATRVQMRLAVRLYADSVEHQLRLLAAELARLAARPEIDLRDGIGSERLLLEATHRNSALFASGVALLDAAGETVWSEPRHIAMLGTGLGDRTWFRALQRVRLPIAEVLEGNGATLVVAVPIVRDGQFQGALLGLAEASQTLPGRAFGSLGEAIIADSAGDAIVPDGAPAWARGAELNRRFTQLLEQPSGGRVPGGGGDLFAVAVPVTGTGLKVMLLGSEDRLLPTMRQRVLLQLLLIAFVQCGAVLLFALFSRRVFRRFLTFEAEAQRRDRLAALGEASSLIAHEVRNSLNGLNAGLSLLTSGAEPELPASAMRSQLDRLRHLASSLLQFARPTAPNLNVGDLRLIASEAIDGLRALPEAGDIELSLALGDTEVPVRCDAALVASAVDNLVRNAIEAAAAAKDTGRTANPRVEVALACGAGEVTLRVSDNAGGPPPDFEKHLFEPFVTSKPKGIGLGLAMAHRAVQLNGGLLRFARTAQGSEFTLCLPLASTAADASRETA